MGGGGGGGLGGVGGGGGRFGGGLGRGGGIGGKIIFLKCFFDLFELFSKSKLVFMFISYMTLPLNQLCFLYKRLWRWHGSSSSFGLLYIRYNYGSISPMGKIVS